GCGSQKRNHMMIGFLDMVDTIIKHRFSLRGRSFLPNDRSFGAVKKVLKQRDGHCLPKEVYEFICNAHKKFTVSMVDTNDILDFKTWWANFIRGMLFIWRVNQ
ncbi:hypothetical protein WA026_020922, partial [Henosepilachna vigintioctopunctata]